MTGFDIFEIALLRLGLADSKGSLEQQEPLKKTVLSLINEIAFELCKAAPIKSLHETPRIDRTAGYIISYKAAYALASITGETEKQATMLAIYNAKRRLYLSRIKTVADVMPETAGG